MTHPKPRAPGLTQAQAQARLQADGPNALPTARPKSLWAIVRGVLVEPMFLMLLCAGGLYLFLGDRAEAIFLLLSVLVIIGITVLQERKTQRALEALRDLSAPHARVIRDGREVQVASTQVVVGDLLVLREGDRIAADARLLDGHLEADESLLTGESVPVRKLPQPSHDAVFAGTVVTRGQATARVDATASATAIGRIGQALAGAVEVTSGLQRASRVLIRRFAIAAVIFAVGLFLLNWLWDAHSLVDSLLSSIALAMAILPEEFPVILTVFLALGAWRITRSRVLTRRISAVEALGAITVLAVDKTGTLTQNRMRVAELFAGDHVFSDDDPSTTPALQELLRMAMQATPDDSHDPMEQAIRATCAKRLRADERASVNGPVVKAYGLQPELLLMTRAMTDVADGHHRLAAKGAPEAVLELSDLDAAARDGIMRRVQSMAERGLRVIAVARAEWSGTTWPETQRAFGYRFVGLVGLIDPPREGAATAMAECRSAGIRVIMMTGDHPATAQAIASQVGLDAAGGCLTGADIDTLDDTALAARLAQVSICARVQPAHKLRLVEVLQRRGEVVGMTGDGVNDAPALKAANVGVAMGLRGTDVAREAAALVLLDDDFASLVAAIRQGRRIYDNIGKATRFVVAVHVPIVALALVPSILHWPILLMPVQIVLLEFLIDPASSIVFESAPEDPGIMRRPPRPVDESPFRWANLEFGALQGAGIAMVMLAGYALLQHLGAAAEQGRFGVFLGLMVAVFLLTLANHDPAHAAWGGHLRANPWLPRMVIGLLLLLSVMIGVPPLRSVLGLGIPSLMASAFAAAMLLACGLWLEIVRRGARRMGMFGVT